MDKAAEFPENTTVYVRFTIVLQCSSRFMSLVTAFTKSGFLVRKRVFSDHETTSLTGLNLIWVFGILNNPAFVTCGRLFHLISLGRENTASTACKDNRGRHTDKHKPRHLKWVQWWWDDFHHWGPQICNTRLPSVVPSSWVWEDPREFAY